MYGKLEKYKRERFEHMTKFIFKRRQLPIYLLSASPKSNNIYDYSTNLIIPNNKTIYHRKEIN